MVSFYSKTLSKEVSFSQLITTNTKLEKRGEIVRDIVVKGLSFAPANASGVELCGYRSKGCSLACVTWFAGRKVMPMVRDAAIARSLFWFEYSDLFFEMLSAELSKLVVETKLDDGELYFRPNESSDVDWSADSRFPWVAKCYDYCASFVRVMRSLAWHLNYQLTFSIKETTRTTNALAVLENGGNIACVVDVSYNAQQKKFGILPSVVSIGGKEFETVDGDVHDVRRREIDGSGKVVLLRLKGTNQAKSDARKLGFAKSISDLGVSSQLERCESGCDLVLR
jgi:hypothetical protein